MFDEKKAAEDAETDNFEILKYLPAIGDTGSEWDISIERRKLLESTTRTGIYFK